MLKMSCCDAVYELDQEVGKGLLRSRQVDNTQSDLTLVRKQEKYLQGWGL